MDVNTRVEIRTVVPPVAKALLRVAGGGLVLAFLVNRLGAAPFRAGFQAVTGQAVLAAIALTALATFAAAWRWRVIATALGARLSLPAAVRAYYRSQFLNSILPGGVLGDGHRALVHGRHVGGVVRAVRAVVWERLAGQSVQTAVIILVLVPMPSPVRPVMPYVAAAVGAALLVVVAIRVGAGRDRRSDGVTDGRLARLVRALSSDLRYGVLARAVWPQLLITSIVVVAAHTTTLIIAFRIVAVPAPAGELVALSMLIQAATAIPLNVGGWGPREGMAAWALAAAGFGASTGVTVTTLYAVIALIAVAPGALLLLLDAVRWAKSTRSGRPLAVHDG